MAKATLIVHERRLDASGGIMEIKVWRVPNPVQPSTHGRARGSGRSTGFVRLQGNRGRGNRQAPERPGSRLHPLRTAGEAAGQHGHGLGPVSARQPSERGRQLGDGDGRQGGFDHLGRRLPPEEGLVRWR